MKHNQELYLMAIKGYETELARIDGEMERLRELLTQPTRRRHRISPEGRARIAEAQRKRWAQIKRKRGKS